MSHTREATFYLAVSPKRYSELSARLTTKVPALAADEVAIQVSVRVPDAIFKRPALKATIEIPEDSVSRPVIEADVVDNIRTELEKQTGLDITIAIVESNDN